MSFFKTDEAGRSFLDWLSCKDKLPPAVKEPVEVEVETTDVLAKIHYLNEMDEKINASINFKAGVYRSIHGVFVSSGKDNFNEWKKDSLNGFLEIVGGEGHPCEYIPIARVLKISSEVKKIKVKYFE